MKFPLGHGATFRKLRQFLLSDKGFAATEFAIIVPLLLALFLGGVSLFDANRASSSLTRATTTMVDLATRQTSMDDGSRDVLFETVTALAGRYGAGSDFFIVMSSISNPADDDDDEAVQLDWSEATIPSKALGEDEIDDLNLPAIGNGESVVVATLSTTYQPMLGWKVVRPWTLKRTAIRRPRFVTVVQYED